MNEIVFVDTNLFLRYLTNDVPIQAEAVERLLHQAARGEIQLVTNSLVVAEIVWTLESFYRLTHSDIRTKILAILNTPGLRVFDADLILQAVDDYVSKNVDFIDAYNVSWIQAHHITIAYTFDSRHFNRFDSITVKTP